RPDRQIRANGRGQDKLAVQVDVEIWKCGKVEIWKSSHFQISRSFFPRSGKASSHRAAADVDGALEAALGLEHTAVYRGDGVGPDVHRHREGDGRAGHFAAERKLSVLLAHVLAGQFAAVLFQREGRRGRDGVELQGRVPGAGDV